MNSMIWLQLNNSLLEMEYIGRSYRDCKIYRNFLISDWKLETSTRLDKSEIIKKEIE